MTANAYIQDTRETTSASDTSSMQRIARIAGVLYLIIIVAGMFAGGFARPSLIVAGDPTATAANILAAEGLFRASILADLAMIMADVAIGVAFYYLLKPVNQKLSLLAALFRLAQAATLGLNLLMLLIALQLLTGDLYTAAVGTEAANALAYLFIVAHDIGYKLALVFFACSILIQGYLLYISRYVPRILSVLLIVASLTYFAYSLATVALVNYDAYAGMFEMMLVFIALPAELLLALWLLIKGVNLEASKQRNTVEQMPAEALSS